MRTIRKNAAACAIDPARIGVFGFSAGGHLASQLETRFAAEVTPPQDAIDALDARPNFGALLYPVISMDPAIAHAGSKTALLGSMPNPATVNLYSSELQVTATTSPTFLGVSTLDTTVDPQNSIRFDNALKAAGVAHELHLYKDGTHGVGIRDAKGDIAAWPEQCATWLRGQKMIGAAQ
jgi:acetyl esterase/lipase